MAGRSLPTAVEWKGAIVAKSLFIFFTYRVITRPRLETLCELIFSPRNPYVRPLTVPLFEESKMRAEAEASVMRVLAPALREAIPVPGAGST